MVRRRYPLGELRELPLTAIFQPWRYRRSIWTQPAITSPHNSSSAYTTSTEFLGTTLSSFQRAGRHNFGRLLPLPVKYVVDKFT